MKGQSLIEVLIALAIAMVVVSAVTVTSISSLSNAQYIKDQDQAAKYAQEGIETMRALRNSDYLGFRSYNGVYCLDAGDTDLGSPVGSCSIPNMDDKFIRSVRVQSTPPSNCGANISRITVTVAFTSGKCQAGALCHSSRLVSCLTTINPIPAP